MSFERIRHPEWAERTSGALDYSRDIRLEGMLVGRVLRCPYPAARIAGLDVSRVRAAPGVAAVLTAADLPDRAYRDYGQMDRVAMAGDRAVYVGQEVAAVAASSLAEADAALSLARVAWEPLPAAPTVPEALAQGAPSVHPDRAQYNVATRAERRFGDVEAARAAAQQRFAGRYDCGAQHHACMEPHSVVADWDGGVGVLNVWTPTQAPRGISAEVAHMLDLAPDQVRLHRVGVGGDFGSRVKAGDIEVIAAHLSIASGRPVAIRLDRAEEFAFAKRQHQTWIDLATHVDDSGRVLFREADVTVDNGAYIQGGSNQMNYCSILLAAHYALQGAEVRGRSVYTNSRPGGAFRGAGGPQATFAIESQMDEIADGLAMDPITLRERNLLQAGATTITGWQIGSTAAADCLSELRRRLDWDAARARGGSGRGVGIALAMHVSGAIVAPPTGRAGAAIEIGQNGGVVLTSGCADSGTGAYGVILQLAARPLGLDPQAIELRVMDTVETPFDPGAGSSRATTVTGGAVAAVAGELAEALRMQAADLLGCARDQVEFADGHVRGGGRSLPLGEVAAQHPHAQGGTLRIERDIDTGLAPVPMTHEDSGYGDISPAYPFAAHGVEVEVDRDTGEVRVLRVVAVHDAGTVINPVGAEGQVVGGVAMGLGMALGEQLLWADGRPHVTSYTDYAMPRADGVPPTEVCFVGGPDPRGTAGGKSISEIALMPVAAAVANAVAHATGARVRTLPITPDKVMAAMPRRRHAQPAPLATRPGRWWTEAVRRAYPKGLLRLLDRHGPSRAGVPAVSASLARPDSTTEAAELLATQGAQAIAGGTGLLPTRAAGLVAPALLVSLSRCHDLKAIRVDGPDLEIGAMATLADMVRVLGDAERPGDRVLARAAGAIATPQIRGAATVAGNLCQTNRCWFLRSGFDCYKRGGTGRPCYAVTGDHRYFHAVVDGGRCQSVTPSDLATVLVALDGELVLQRRGGHRVARAEAFFTGPGETCLRRGEIVVSIRVPAAARARHAAWDKLQLTSDGFAVASACASLRTDADGCIRAARIVLGGVSGTPWRARDSEAMLIGWSVGSIDADRAAEAWIRRAHPLPDNRWKLDATAGLLRRVLGEALGRRVPDNTSS